MKPTWEGWADVYAAQHQNVESNSECLYSGRWSEHDDINWDDWNKSYELIPPVTWDHCVEPYTNLVTMISKLSMLIDSSGLWNPVQDNTATLWKPVEYPK